VSEVQTVFLVDDDAALRESMALMLDQAGFRVRTFDSAHAFLEAYAASDTGCLVLDLRMPGMNGLELQEAHRVRNRRTRLTDTSCYRFVREAEQFVQLPVRASGVDGVGVDGPTRPRVR